MYKITDDLQIDYSPSKDHFISVCNNSYECTIVVLYSFMIFPLYHFQIFTLDHLSLHLSLYLYVYNILDKSSESKRSYIARDKSVLAASIIIPLLSKRMRHIVHFQEALSHLSSIIGLTRLSGMLMIFIQSAKKIPARVNIHAFTHILKKFEVDLHHARGYKM